MNHRIAMTLIQLFGIKRRKSTLNNLGLSDSIPIDSLQKIKSLKHFDFHEIISTLESLQVFQIESGYLLVKDYEGELLIREWVLEQTIQRLRILPKGFKNTADIYAFYSQFGNIKLHQECVQFSSLLEYKKALIVWQYDDEPIEHHLQVDSILHELKEFCLEPKEQDRMVRFILEDTEFMTVAKLKTLISSICPIASIIWYSPARIGYVLFKDNDAETVLRVTKRLDLEIKFERMTMEEQILYQELFKDQILVDKQQKTQEAKFLAKPTKKVLKKGKKTTEKLLKTKQSVKLQKKTKKVSPKHSADMLALLESMAV